VIGTIVGTLASLVGGFLADGGDTTPGKSFIVGERGPELIVPRSAKTVIPNHALGAGTSKVINLGGVHIHGATDMDSFKKSGPQIQRDFGRTIQVASARS
jgi:hypothetical protein